MKPKFHHANWPSPNKRAIECYQARKLTLYLRRNVLPFSKFYRALFKACDLEADSIRSLDDLRKLPFTTKEDLLTARDHPQRAHDFLLIPDARVLARRPSTIIRAVFQGREFAAASLEYEYRPVFMTATTGRAAEPVAFVYTRADLDNLALAGGRIMEVCGARHEWRMINMFPYAPHLGFWQVHYAGLAFGTFVVSSGGGKVMGTAGNLRMIKKLTPDVLIGMPTFVYHVLHEATEEGLRCDTLKRIVLGGEKAPAGMQEKLRALASQLGSEQVEILTTYGFTEAKMAWAECPHPRGEESSGYHLYPDLGIIEIINPQTGEVMPEGRGGEIVFTPLAARGSVVLRYRTGDLIDGGLVYEKCPYCGRNMPRLVGRISRNSEMKQMQFEKLKGTLIDFNELEHLLDEAEHVGAWQIELRKRDDDPLEVDEIIVHINKTGRIDDKKLARQLSERFAESLELHPNQIQFHTAGEMRALQGVGEQLKEKRIIDHRPSATAPAGRNGKRKLVEAVR